MKNTLPHTLLLLVLQTLLGCGTGGRTPCTTSDGKQGTLAQNGVCQITLITRDDWCKEKNQIKINGECVDVSACKPLTKVIGSGEMSTTCWRWRGNGLDDEVIQFDDVRISNKTTPTSCALDANRVTGPITTFTAESMFCTEVKTSGNVHSFKNTTARGRSKFH
jgi:hypothetical protein